MLDGQSFNGLRDSDLRICWCVKATWCFFGVVQSSYIVLPGSGDIALTGHLCRESLECPHVSVCWCSADCHLHWSRNQNVILQ